MSSFRLLVSGECWGIHKLVRSPLEFDVGVLVLILHNSTLPIGELLPGGIVDISRRILYYSSWLQITVRRSAKIAGRIASIRKMKV